MPVSPYINRFIQPDTIIPNPANPQSWNRYSYVVNRPINLNDPDGHCAPVCVIPLIDLVLIVVIATAAYYIIVPPPPELVEEIESGIQSISNSLEGWQQNNTGQKQRDYMDSISGKTADNGGWMPGPNPSGRISCADNPFCIFALTSLIVGVAAKIVKTVYDALFCSIDSDAIRQKCDYDHAEPTPEPTQTQTLRLTPVTMPTSNCPPYIQCPSASSTPQPPPTSMPTQQPPLNILTQPSAPSNSPRPRRNGELIPY